MEQINLFDWLDSIKTPEYPRLDQIDEAEAVRIIGDKLHVVFKYNGFLEEWEGKAGDIKLTLHYDHYDMTDCADLFLSVGYDRGRHGGGGIPADSIGEAIEYLRRKSRTEKEEQEG